MLPTEPLCASTPQACVCDSGGLDGDVEVAEVGGGESALDEGDVAVVVVPSKHLKS